jgi:hypothetical protein
MRYACKLILCKVAIDSILIAAYTARWYTLHIKHTLHVEVECAICRRVGAYTQICAIYDVKAYKLS